MADFEWDPHKEVENVRKHGIDFTTASQVWSGPVYEQIDDRKDYGETRILTFGISESRVLAVLYTWRGTTRRIISARRSNARERRRHEEEIHNRGDPAQN